MEPVNDEQRGGQLFHDIVNVLPVSLYLVDVEREHNIFANRLLLDFLCLSMEQFLKMRLEDFEDLICQNDLGNYHKVKEQLFTGPPNGPAEVKIRVENGKGEMRWMNCQMSAYNRSSDNGVTQLLFVMQDVTENKEILDRLEYMCFHDPLTGLYNRVYYIEQLARLERSRQFPVSIMLVDVDGLKTINDTFGHPLGDKVLSESAMILANVFRAEDIIARIGGDEFAVILPEVDAWNAQEVAKRIKKEIKKRNGNEGALPFSLSVGTATADKGESLLDALRKADNEMYKDKSRRKRRNTTPKGRLSAAG